MLEDFDDIFFFQLLFLFLTYLQVVRLDIVRNRKIDEALRAVAYAVAMGKIPHTTTSKQLLDLVINSPKATVSGLDYWAIYQPKHDLIV